MIQYLVYYNLITEAEEVNKEMKLYEAAINFKVKSLRQILFEEANPELFTIYPQIKAFDHKVHKAFEMFLNNFDHVLL